jgi:hypothetical protein
VENIVYTRKMHGENRKNCYCRSFLFQCAHFSSCQTLIVCVKVSMRILVEVKRKREQTNILRLHCISTVLMRFKVNQTYRLRVNAYIIYRCCGVQETTNDFDFFVLTAAEFHHSKCVLCSFVM